LGIGIILLVVVVVVVVVMSEGKRVSRVVVYDEDVEGFESGRQLMSL